MEKRKLGNSGLKLLALGFCRTIVTFILLFFSAQLFAQSDKETTVLRLSKDVFRWEIDGKIDSLENLFDEKFIVVGSNGDLRNKNQYLGALKSGNPVHNSINVEENVATIVDNTATVMGKGKFDITVSGAKKILHLSYMEVFAKKINGWKLVALYASKLPD